MLYYKYIKTAHFPEEANPMSPEMIDPENPTDDRNAVPCPSLTPCLQCGQPLIQGVCTNEVCPGSREVTIIS